MTTMREASKQPWDFDNKIKHINAGSLQRIADATEKMALRHTDLMPHLDTYKRWYREEVDRRRTLERSLAAHKGQIAKLKKRLAAGNQS